LFNPAVKLAERGFPVSERLVFYIRQEKDRLKLFQASRAVFLDKNGEPLKTGTVLSQPDLAKTFRLIQQQGPDVFYQGEIGRDIVKAVREAPYHPGLMREADLAAYRVVRREPVSGGYRGYDIFSMGPPSSGGTTLIETLHILERFPLSDYSGTPQDESPGFPHARGNLKFPSPQALHLFSEAQKLAFRDRNLFLGDPDFVKVPVEKLLSKSTAQKGARAIQMDTVIPDVPVQTSAPLNANAHTSHLSIVDARGNMAAFTTTIEEMFGSAMMVPGRGFFLNNELTDFDLEVRQNRHPRANAIQGGKRPRSSMAPTFIFKEGKPFLIIGSPGGSKIIGAVLNVVINRIDFGMPLERAMRSPRLINRDGDLEMETDLFKDLRQRLDLGARGHRIVESAPIGNVQAISFNQKDGFITGISDPRGEGEAKGY
ncbi:MAG TPA: gamma-glutamyltransferase family protein, partial [bacterium]|nr:gamma-glutamyltransferase family protein [bacterium]